MFVDWADVTLNDIAVTVQRAQERTPTAAVEVGVDRPVDQARADLYMRKVDWPIQVQGKARLYRLS